MNSTWNTNIALFEKRFPALKEILCEDIAFFEKETEEGRSPLPLEFLAAKNGSPTALYKADASGGDATGTNASGGNATGTNATRTNATGTNASGGDATGTNASGTNATAGTGTNGDATGGNAAKTDESRANAAKSVPAKQPAISLHSKYNPEREAEQLVKEFSKNDFDAAVFLGFGLGYAPIAFAEKNPSTPLILIENNPLFLFAALNTLDFTKV
ncbi:MAG: hypothetical protein II077_14285, partial [Treponema sp.]|nr:hypothetical protein [Treponema sp.]